MCLSEDERFRETGKLAYISEDGNDFILEVSTPSQIKFPVSDAFPFLKPNGY